MFYWRKQRLSGHLLTSLLNARSWPKTLHACDTFDSTAGFRRMGKTALVTPARLGQILQMEHRRVSDGRIQGTVMTALLWSATQELHESRGWRQCLTMFNHWLTNGCFTSIHLHFSMVASPRVASRAVQTTFCASCWSPVASIWATLETLEKRLGSQAPKPWWHQLQTFGLSCFSRNWTGLGVVSENYPLVLWWTNIAMENGHL